MSIDFDCDLDFSPETMNLNNANGAALLGVLGFSTEPWGECTIAEARRGVIRARNRSSLAGYERKAVNERRCFSPEFTSEDLLERIDRFAKLVERCAAAGAKKIRWS